MSDSDEMSIFEALLRAAAIGVGIKFFVIPEPASSAVGLAVIGAAAGINIPGFGGGD